MVRAQGYISGIDREKSRAGILLWGELAPGWLGDIFLPHAGLQPGGRLHAPPGEGDGLPCPGTAALRQAAVSSWQQERGRHTQQHPTTPERRHYITPCHICLSRTTARRWQRTTQLHPALPEFLRAGHRAAFRDQETTRLAELKGPHTPLVPACSPGRSESSSIPACRGTVQRAVTPAALFIEQARVCLTIAMGTGLAESSVLNHGAREMQASALLLTVATTVRRVPCPPSAARSPSKTGSRAVAKG